MALKAKHTQDEYTASVSVHVDSACTLFHSLGIIARSRYITVLGYILYHKIQSCLVDRPSNYSDASRVNGPKLSFVILSDCKPISLSSSSPKVQ